ncbi:MAG: aminopeptidase P family protein, partial [Firmicutes bacterium]|nr:aminopeptidase P family protein [Bacillota bacterium]
MFDNIDACVIFNPVNRFYFTKLETSSGCVILTESEKIFITDFRYIEVAKKALPNYRVVMSERKLFPAVAEELKTLAVCTKQEGGELRLGFEDEFLSVATYAKLKEAIAGIVENAKYVPISRQIALKRAIKTDEEISKVAAAQVVAQKALTKTIASLKVGVTEREAAAELLYEMQCLGADGMSFDTIVAFGAGSAMPHYKTGDRRLEKNDIILVDMGAKMNGYCSDMTRTFCFGDAGKRLEEIHALVLAAQTAALKGIKAGMTGREADSIAREYFKANGYIKEFGHSLGHGIGLEVHETPSLAEL